MQTFILLTRLISEEVHPSFRIEEMEKATVARIEKYLPEVSWISNFALIGPWDYLDIFSAPDMDAAMKVSAIVRHYGGAHTEMWPATEWNHFEQLMRELTEVVKQ
ncbi:MAG TPA: GYD domain-containing protein [Micavibrio sp.]